MNDVEPNDLPADAMQLTPGDPSTGTLGSASDEDYYAIDVDQAGVILLSFDAPPQESGFSNFGVSVLDQNGDLLAARRTLSDFTLDVGVPAAGTYYVKINTDNPYEPSLYVSAPYTLTVSTASGGEGAFENESNNSFASAGSLPLGTPVHGQLANNSDVDYFRVEVGAPGVLDLAIEYTPSVGNWITLSILDAAGTRQSSYQRVEGSASVHALIDSPGTYYVGVAPGQFAGLDYDNSGYLVTASLNPAPAFSEVESNDSMEAATVIGLGADVAGRADSATDVDYFVADIPAPGIYDITFRIPEGIYGESSSTAPPYFATYTVKVFDASSNLLVQANVYRDSTFSFGAPVPDSYYFSVENNFTPYNSGTYLLNVAAANGIAVDTLEAEANGTLETANVISLGDLVRGDVAHGGGNPSGGDVDYYALDMGETGILTVTFDPRIYSGQSVEAANSLASVVDANGNVLAGAFVDSDTGPQFSAAIHSAGTYYIKVDGGLPGSYTFRTTFEPGAASGYETESNNSVDLAQPISIGGTYHGYVFGDSDDYYALTVSDPIFLHVERTITWGEQNSYFPFGYVVVDPEENFLQPGPGGDYAAFEAGTYHIKILGTQQHYAYDITVSQGVGDVLAYQAALEVESNDDTTSANAIDVNATRYGYLNSETDADYYRIDLASPADLHVEFDIPDNAPNTGSPAYQVTILDSNGNAIVSRQTIEDFSIDALTPDESSYYIKVEAPLISGTTIHSYYGAFLYSFVASGRTENIESENNDTAATADPLAFGDSIAGQIGAQTDVDHYVLTADATGVISLSMDSPDANHRSYKLTVTDDLGNTIYETDYFGSNSVPFNRAIDFGAHAIGNYHVAVSAPGSFNAADAGTYHLHADFTAGGSDAYEWEDNDSLATANELTFGSTIHGLRGIHGDDYYRFTVTEPGILAVTGGAFDVDGNRVPMRYGSISTIEGIEFSGTPDPDSDDTTLFVVSPGDYYLHGSGGISYDLTLDFSSGAAAYVEPGNLSIETAQELALGTSIVGHVGSAENDFFRIDVSEGDALLLDIQSPHMDHGTSFFELGMTARVISTGRIEYARWNWVDASTTGLMAINEPGTYYIDVGGSIDSGIYTLNATTITGGWGDDYAANSGTTGAIALNGSATGSIDIQQDRDWFKVELREGRSYAIKAEGYAHDAGTSENIYVYAVDENGNPLGNSSWASATFVAPASGTYFLSVAGDVGTYTVTFDSINDFGVPPVPTDNTVPLTGDVLIDGLTQGSSWQFSEPVHAITYSLSLNDSDDPSNNPEWRNDYVREIQLALEKWSVIADIKFVEIGNGTTYRDSPAEIAITLTGNELEQTFGDGFVSFGFFPSPVFADLFLSDAVETRDSYPQPEGDVFFDNNFGDSQDPGFVTGRGGLGTLLMVHEIGHALGLKHPDDDGANMRPTFKELGISNLDSNLYSIMSYEDARGAPLGRNPYSNASTPMPLDILAIQSIYGANTTYHTGDDTYYLTGLPDASTIWDAGGDDTIAISDVPSFSTFGPATIDLREGMFSSISYTYTAPNGRPFKELPQLLAIAYDVTIENAVGGPSNDTLTGNDAANVLDGAGGTDKLSGGMGNDTYVVDLATSGASIKLQDTITENAEEGTDTLQLRGSFTLARAVTLTLANNLENLDAADTGSAPLNLTGNDLDNTLTGNDAANILDGKAGSDTLIGGLGNDTYLVDAPDDTAVENAGEGTDLVKVAIASAGGTYALGANAENAILTSNLAFNLMGNSLDNALTGNAAANVLTGGVGNDTLDGGKGADTLVGGAGDDAYVVDDAGDVAIENADEGSDLVKVALARGSYTLGANLENGAVTSNGAIGLVGSDLANILSGNASANTLDGDLGADTLVGGKGNDTYIVDDAGDVVVENASEGNDLVQSSVSFTLGSNVENLTLTGTADIDGIGNSLANTLTGNDGANVLDGAGGKDKLTGGKGDDTYIVDLASTGGLEDTITESANAGSDTITLRGEPFLTKAVALTLANNLENLDTSATGSMLLNLNGNSVANTLTGNAANNTLDGKGGDDILIGGMGKDTLTGGAGADTFVFDALPSSSVEADLIKDFVSGSDHLAFDTTIFDALAFSPDGSLVDGQFASGAGMTTAADATTRLLYDSSTGGLYYDSDGGGASAALLILTLGTSSHPGLGATDLIQF